VKTTRQGFTLLEVVIVSAIIGLVAVIAVPSYLKPLGSSQTSACFNNMRLLDSAMQQYALDNTNALATSLSQLVGTNGYLRVTPVCKAGGTYTLPGDLAGSKTACSVHGAF